MAYSRPFGTNALTGARETIHFDDDGHITIETEVDNTAILAANAEARKNAPSRWGDSWEKDGQTFV